MTRALPATVPAQIAIPTMFFNGNVTRVLPALIGAHLTILMSKSADFANENTTKVLPATLGAQITTLVEFVE